MGHAMAAKLSKNSGTSSPTAIDNRTFPESTFQGTQRYSIEARLGSGGFGVVYRALDRESGERVAIKLLKRMEPKALYDFTARIPGAVGCPLGSDTDRLRGALRQLAEAVSFLHRSGKLHRDLKPANVLVTEQGVTIAPGPAALVYIVLQQSAPPDPFQNSAPVIDSLVASAIAVAPGATVSLEVTAHDPDPGDTLTYGWAAGAGAFDDPASTSPVWTAPTADGPVTLTVTVTDTQASAQSLSVVITVSQSAGTADADVQASLNTWPVITGLVADPSQVDASETTSLNLTSTDADGDPLTYAWGDGGGDCAGSFSSSTAQSPTWTAPATAPTSGTCTLNVTVTDNRGGSTTGVITIQVGSAPSPNGAPVITNTFQSSAGVAPGAGVLFKVTATDPESQALTFAWSAGTGTLATPTNTASTSEVTWTAPASGCTHTVTVDVSDTESGVTSHDFTVATCGTCGNGVIEGGEQCDGTDLGGASCASLGLGSGTLACKTDCTFNLSGCTAPTASWGTEELIQTNAITAYRPHVAIDNNGNAIAVWYQYDGTAYSIYAKRYDATSGSWGNAQIIETSTDKAVYPMVAMDGNGNAIAVWKQDNSIYANRYDAAADAWGTAQLIEADSGTAWYPQIAMDGNGNAIAVWPNAESGTGNVYANRYDAATGSWGTSQLLESDAGTAGYARISVNSTGDAMAVWTQWDGSAQSMNATRYDVTTDSWGSVQLLETGAGECAYTAVAMDDSGNAVAVWRQKDGTVQNMYANWFDGSAASWGTAQLIETGSADALYPQVAMDSSGNAIAVWQQSGITANRRVAATGAWGTAQTIGSGLDPQLAMDSGGSAISVWRHYDAGDYVIYSNRYSLSAP